MELADLEARFAIIEALVYQSLAKGGGGGGGGVAAVLATLPLTASGTTTRTLAINPATESTAGSLSAADKIKIDALGTILAVPVSGFISTLGTAQTSTPTVDLAQAWPSVGAPASFVTLVLASISVTPGTLTDHVQVILQRDDIGPIGPNFTFTGQAVMNLINLDVLSL